MWRTANLDLKPLCRAFHFRVDDDDTGVEEHNVLYRFLRDL